MPTPSLYTTLLSANAASLATGFRGIECGPGWAPLVAACFEAIDRDRQAGADARVLQVKEKFGTLRVYTAGASPETQAAIAAAGKTSAGVCEDTGRPGVLHTNGGWLRTLNPERAQALNAELDQKRGPEPPRYWRPMPTARAI